jgi:hypothetical protein
MVLTLFGQPNDVRNPVYDRSGLVVGELEMKYPERVVAVSVKVSFWFESFFAHLLRMGCMLWGLGVGLGVAFTS